MPLLHHGPRCRLNSSQQDIFGDCIHILLLFLAKAQPANGIHELELYVTPVLYTKSGENERERTLSVLILREARKDPSEDAFATSLLGLI